MALAVLLTVAGPAAADLDAVARALDASRLSDARRLLAALPEAERSSALGQYFAGRLASLFGPPDAPANHAERCLERAPALSRCHEIRGEALLQSLDGASVTQAFGTARRTRAAWEQAVALDGGNLRARLLLLRFYGGAPWIVGGSRAKAEAQAEAIEARDPVRGIEARALLAHLAEDFPAAAAGFREALAKDPHSRDLHFMHITSLADAGRRSEALAAIDAARTQLPEFPQLDMLQARITAEAFAAGKQTLDPALRETALAAADRFLQGPVELPRQRGEVFFARARLNDLRASGDASLDLLSRAALQRAALDDYAQARTLSPKLEPETVDARLAALREETLPTAASAP